MNRRRRNRNKPPINFKELFDYVHTECTEYGISPLRIFEYVRTIQPLKFNSVLDVGCATGQLLKWIKHTRPNVKCYGTDISQIALDKIKDCDAELKQAQVQKLPYQNDQFDLVICTHVLDHIPQNDLPNAISELKRVGNGHVWIQVHECNLKNNGTAEDKYLTGTKYDGMSLLTIKEYTLWWEKAIQRQRLQIVQKQRIQKKLSFLCYVHEGLINYMQHVKNK